MAKNTHPPMVMSVGVRLATPFHPILLKRMGDKNIMAPVKRPTAVATSPMKAEKAAGVGQASFKWLFHTNSINVTDSACAMVMIPRLFTMGLLRRVVRESLNVGFFFFSTFFVASFGSLGLFVEIRLLCGAAFTAIKGSFPRFGILIFLNSARSALPFPAKGSWEDTGLL